jgi:hypothetical protein
MPDVILVSIILGVAVVHLLRCLMPAGVMTR